MNNYQIQKIRNLWMRLINKPKIRNKILFMIQILNLFIAKIKTFFKKRHLILEISNFRKHIE